MTFPSILRLALAIIVAGALGTAAAQDRSQERSNGRPGEPRARSEQQQAQPAGKGVLRLLPGDSVTEHAIDTPAGKLAYSATAGTLAFYDQSGEQSAAVFYTAYVVKNATPNRPLTFVFNGGPGAASAFLHLGLAGPRILDFGPGARDAAQAQLRDNPDTWLGFTDLVMIDPIGTGWSRAAKAEDAKSFWNAGSDASAMAKAIALYVAKNARAGSPKYLLGESYGGFRAAKTARALQREQGIAINGIVMVSPLLAGWLTFGDDGSALGSALKLPSLAAATLERKGKFSAATLAEAEKFAMTDYLTTLAGPAPRGDAAEAFYGRLAEMSGRPLEAVMQSRGFITSTFVRNLRSFMNSRLPTDKKVVGLFLVSPYDATFAVDDPFPEVVSGRAPDPILDGVTRAYGGAFAAYARNELGFKTDMTYALLANDVTRQWDWRGGRVQASVEDDLRVMLSFSPSFRLLIAHGYSDIVTPYAASRYVLDHLPPNDPPGRAQLKLYRGGHMLYLDPQSRKAFSADASAFYRKEWYRAQRLRMSQPASTESDIRPPKFR